MPIPEMYEDEIINTIKHSKTINIIVEGKDDCFIYRKIEEVISDIDLIICSGRNTLVKLFNRRDEFANAKYIFFADQDTYLFKGIPVNYSEIIWTNGYSIENDILNNSDILNIAISQDKREYFSNELSLLELWYASEMVKAIANEEYNVDLHPKAIIENAAFKPDFEYLLTLSIDIPEIIKQEPLRSIRGKNITNFIHMYYNNNDFGAKCNPKALLLFTLSDINNDFNRITLPKIMEKKNRLTTAST